jgi:uncharacterized phage-like protein YoqJ
MISLINRENTCCFSGYRPEKLPWGYDETDERCRALKRKLYDVAEAVYDSGVRHYICGMARGCDTYFCEAVLRLRGAHPEVSVEAALPCEEQAAKWPELARSRYYNLMQLCDVETLVSRKFTSDCMMRRNRYMVDKSSIIVVVFDGRFGGTMYTRGYAAKRGLEIIDIRP